MTTIQRYVLWEILKVFLLCLGITVLIMTVGGGMNEGLRKGLPPSIIVHMLPYFVPEMLRYTIPGCMLFAVCTTFGRMAASNEITAIKSAGINPFELMWPVLTLAYFLSFFTFWVYDACASWSRPNVHRVIVQSLDDTAYGMLRTQRSFSMSGLSVTVKNVEDRKLINPIIHVAASDSEPEIYLTAAVAELRTDPKTGILQLTCFDGRVEVVGEGSFDFSDDEFIHKIDHLGSVELDQDSATPANLTLSVIPHQIEREKEIIADAEKEIAAAEVAGTEVSSSLERHHRRHQTRLFRLEAERQRRLANGFGCFCFACIGIPVAIWWRSSDNVSTFFLCFLPILLVYYPLLVTGEKLARDGDWGPGPVWIANLVLLVLSAILLLRVNRN